MYMYTLWTIYCVEARPGALPRSDRAFWAPWTKNICLIHHQVLCLPSPQSWSKCSLPNFAAPRNWRKKATHYSLSISNLSGHISPIQWKARTSTCVGKQVPVSPHQCTMTRIKNPPTSSLMITPKQHPYWFCHNPRNDFMDQAVQCCSEESQAKSLIIEHPELFYARILGNVITHSVTDEF